MSLEFCAPIILVTACAISLAHLRISYHKIQQALHWWSARQSTKLFLEAEKIRDGLLQETFTIRRSLDILPVDNLGLSLMKTQECLKKSDNLHQSLAKLSDRLFPAYLEYSFPLAIECLLEPFLASNANLNFHIDLPANWRYEPGERSLIILRALEELLTITLPAAPIPISVSLTLKEKKNIGQLIVEITYPDASTLTLYSQVAELEYLCASFRFLTLGKCFIRRKNLCAVWHLYW